MLTIYKKETLGRFDNEWLQARFHFSFGDYHNPKRVSFGSLRVINDDVIAAGAGFDMHPHKDMEIITYVRDGAILHRDSMGNAGRTGAGDVQVMSAGTGVYHSEAASPDQPTRSYQIWIRPRERSLPPRWAQAEFPKQPVRDALPLLVSGFAEDAGKGALSIYQDASIHGGRLADGTTLRHPVRGQAYILVSEGRIRVDGQELVEGDGAEATDLPMLEIEALGDAALLILDV